MVLENHYIIKLKIILKSKITIIICSIFIICYLLYFTKIKYYDKSYNDIKYIEGIINNIEIIDNDVKIYIDKYLILINYDYIKKININIGNKIRVYGNIKIPDEEHNFNMFNYRKYLLSKKIKYLYYANEIEVIDYRQGFIYSFKTIINNRINSLKSSKYLKLFILNDKSNIDDKVYDSYKENGIIHMFSISGVHISLISSLIIYIFKRELNTNFLTYILLFIILVIYIFLTNYSISIIRSSLLLLFSLLNKKFKLNISIIYILFYIFFISILYNPYSIYNIGFIFSYTISFFLIKYSSIIRSYNNYLLRLLFISLISFLSSIPILINSNYSINFLSIIYNIIFGPFISLIIFPLSLLTFIFSPLELILLFLMNIFERISLLLSNIKIFNITLCKMSFISISIYYLIIIFILDNIKIKKYMYLLIIIFILLFHHYIRYFDYDTKVNFFNVGQGDSILLELPHNKNILIDTGGNKSNSISKNIIIPSFKSRGIYKLDYFVITHGDYDHMGEAINLVNNFKVEKVIFNCGPYNDLEKELIKVLDKKKIKYYSCIKELNIDDNKLYFLQTKEYDNENDNSNVIYTEINRYKFMFMGDAGVTTEKEILDKYNLPDMDVLKVGHHGSKTSSSKEFIDEINPKYSIISVGKNNRYGHPNKEVLDNLNNSKIYRTDQDGSIMFKIKNNKLKIETCSP